VSFSARGRIRGHQIRKHTDPQKLRSSTQRRSIAAAINALSAERWRPVLIESQVGAEIGGGVKKPVVERFSARRLNDGRELALISAKYA
jgi:hypothetical protein